MSQPSSKTSTPTKKTGPVKEFPIAPKKYDDPNVQELYDMIQRQKADLERLRLDNEYITNSVYNLQDDAYDMQKSILSSENNIKTLREGVSATLELMFGMFKKLFAISYNQDESAVSIIKEMKLTSVRCTTCTKSFKVRPDSNYTGSKFTCPDCPRPPSRKFKAGPIGALQNKHQYQKHASNDVDYYDYEFYDYQV
jgi:hypothetical protein